MISWPTYTLGQAQKDFELLTSDNVNQINLSHEFQLVRDELIEARDVIYDKYEFDNGLHNKYAFDLEFGLALYKTLNNKIENRDIYLDDVWRFLSIKVTPDIVHARWDLNADRFYRMSRRIYLKQLWWYIHLSWDTNVKRTYEILKDNTTDTILNLVERPGLGYNIEMYREIMKQYSNYDDNDRTLLRRVMVLNTARSKNLSPELVDGGVTGYVNQLFKDVL